MIRRHPVSLTSLGRNDTLSGASGRGDHNNANISNRSRHDLVLFTGSDDGLDDR